MKPATLCKNCGDQITRAPQARYCSPKCKDLAWGKIRTERNQARLRNKGKIVAGDSATCAFALCGSQFVVWHTGQRFCSADCREKHHGRTDIGNGTVLACRVYFGKCVHCGAIKATESKAMRNRLACKSCRALIQARNDQRKNHTRRGAGVMTMTVQDIAERDGRRCCICGQKIDLSRSGSDRLGPTIEHLLPISKGGTNHPANLGLAHRVCNVSRGNRGAAQLMLETDDAWATAKAN